MITVQVFHNSILKSCSYCIYDDTTLEGYIIDIGDVPPIISFIRKHQIQINGLFLTHSHFDHIYGLAQFAVCFPTLSIYCSADTFEGLKDEDINMSYMYLEDAFKIPQTNNYVLIDENSSVTCFGLTIQIVSCPGHDSGCLSYIIDNNIFTGDSYTPFAPVTYNWHRGDKKLALESEALILNLIQSNGLKVFPGHYQD